MNLSANAIDALEDSHCDCQITICTAIENDHVKVSISDSGTGMSETVKARIFDYQFTTKSLGKGTGLTLAIAHSIVVEKHSDTLKVNLVLGQGTEFILPLPVQLSR